jgi:arabinogalactan oligomer / maltooligosaccharide transport system substrate-binding protein
MNRRSLWLSMALALIAMLMLAACAPAATPEATEAPAEETDEAAGGGGTVVLWHGYSAGSAEEATLTELIENAKAEFPDMTIEVLQVPFGELFTKYETEVSAGGGPDMFVAPNDNLGNEARGSLVAPLDDLLTAEDLAGVTETGVEGMKVDGVLYGVPESAKAVALYYNKSLVDTPATTTDELLEQVQGGTTMTNVISQYHMFGWSGAFGGELMDADGKCVADQGGWVDALNYLLELKEAGATFNGDYATAEDAFKNGEAAYWVNGPWALADYKAILGDDLGVAVLPSGPGGDANPLNGIDGFYINPNSDNQASAVALALFLSSGDSAQAYTDDAGHVPIRDSVTTSDPLVATFAEASAKGLPRPQSAELGNYWTPFQDMFTKVLEGQSTPEDAVAEACAAMNTANNK